MASTQQQPTPAFYPIIPTLRINTDFSNARKIPFEQINSAPVTRREMGFPDPAHGHHDRPSEAFASDNWRSTMAVPNDGNSPESNSDEPSPENVFSSNEEAGTPESMQSEGTASLGKDKKSPDVVVVQVEQAAAINSPYARVDRAVDLDRTPETSPVERHPALARLISHGCASVASLSGRVDSVARDKLDIIELLPVTLSPDGKVVCQHHDDLGGTCACESFPLVEIGVSLDRAAQSNRVCYPIEEVDESQIEDQPSPQLSPEGEKGSIAILESPTLGAKREDEAERFEGLLGKLRKSAEEKCDKLIKEWKDPVTGRSEPLSTWDRETLVAWTRRFNEYKDLIYRKYAPHSDRGSASERVPLGLGPEATASPEQLAPKPREPKDSGIDMEIPTKERSLNPKAEEFRPPLKRTGSGFGVKVGRQDIQTPVAPPKLNGLGRCVGSGGNGAKPADIPQFPATPLLPLTPGLASLYDGNLAPPPLSLAALLAQVYGTASPLPVLPMCSPTLPTLKPGFSAPSPVAGFGGMCGLHAAHPPHSCQHRHLGCPWTSCSNRRPVVPVSPALKGLPRILPPALSQVPPGPMPKPRFPDARGQQAYEEWIEWRKANEPGYALECKARQARRAYRGRGPPRASVGKEDSPEVPGKQESEFMKPLEGSTRGMGVRSEG